MPLKTKNVRATQLKNHYFQSIKDSENALKKKSFKLLLIRCFILPN